MLIQHVGGLSEEDARRLIRIAIRDDGKITLADIGKVLKTKHEFLKASEILSLSRALPHRRMRPKNLKRWLAVRRDFHIRRPFAAAAPKGVLLLGVQGAGKSWHETAAGARYLPLFRPRLRHAVQQVPRRD